MPTILRPRKLLAEHWQSLLMLLAGSGLAWLLLILVQGVEQRTARTEFRRAAQSDVVAVQEALERSINDISVLAAFVETTHPTTRAKLSSSILRGNGSP